MKHIIERNVYMAFGAWVVVIYQAVEPTVPLWQIALGLTLGGAIFTMMAWSRGVR